MNKPTLRQVDNHEALLVRKSAEELRERAEAAEAQVAALTAENATLRKKVCDLDELPWTNPFVPDLVWDESKNGHVAGKSCQWCDAHWLPGATHPQNDCLWALARLGPAAPDGDVTP